MNKDELIYRGELLAAYDAAHKGPPGGARKLMQEAPAIDAAPVVHGRWIDHKDEHQCSECHEFAIVDFYVWKNMPFDYCPNCGAKMDEDGETC